MTTKLNMVVHEQSTIKRRGIYDPVESDPTSDEEDCTYDEEDCTSDEEDVLQGKKNEIIFFANDTHRNECYFVCRNRPKRADWAHSFTRLLIILNLKQYYR